MTDLYNRAASSPGLDDATTSEAARGLSSGGTFYRALLHSLDPEDQQWVLATVARQRAAELHADQTGESLPRALI